MSVMNTKCKNEESWAHEEKKRESILEKLAPPEISICNQILQLPIGIEQKSDNKPGR